MLHTGWDEYYGQTPEYLFEFPYLTGEAAEYLVSLDPKAVGTEGASVGGWADEAPAHGPATDVHPADSHLPLLENDIIPIEELRNLDAVLDGADSRRASFFFPPLNLQGNRRKLRPGLRSGVETVANQAMSTATETASTMLCGDATPSPRCRRPCRGRRWS